MELEWTPPRITVLLGPLIIINWEYAASFALIYNIVPFFLLTHFFLLRSLMNKSALMCWAPNEKLRYLVSAQYFTIFPCIWLDIMFFSSFLKYFWNRLFPGFKFSQGSWITYLWHVSAISTGTTYFCSAAMTFWCSFSKLLHLMFS